MNLEGRYPPYRGRGDTVFLCFADNDAKRIAPVLEKLYSKGCKLNYYRKNSKRDSESATEAIKRASLAVLFLSEETKNDIRCKSDILYAADCHKKILALQCGDDVRPEDFNLPKDTPVVSGAEELMRTEGFYSGLLAPDEVHERSVLPKTVALILTALAVTVVLAGFLFRTFHQDPASVTEIRLSSLPTDYSRLEDYPNLKKIIVPQSAISADTELPDNYEIVIEG